MITNGNVEAIGLDIDIMPRALARTLFAGTLIGGGFWALVAAMLMR